MFHFLFLVSFLSSSHGWLMKDSVVTFSEADVTALSKVPSFLKSLSLYVVYVIHTFIVTCDCPLMSVLNACVSLLKEAHDSRGHPCVESSV